MLNKIKLYHDGTFEVIEIIVTSSTKNGEVIGKGESGKPIYERVPAKIWETSIGKINIELCGKCRDRDDYFEIITDRNIEQSKLKLKDYAIGYFKSLAGIYEQRILDYQQNIRDCENKLESANERLKNIRRIDLDL